MIGQHHVALAHLGEVGEASIAWRSTRKPQPAAMTIVELGQALQDEAPYRPSGTATALVRDMTDQASYQPGVFAVMTASQDGGLVIEAADVEDWIEAKSAPSQQQQDSALPPATPHPATPPRELSPEELAHLPAPAPDDTPLTPVVKPGGAMGFPILEAPAPKHGLLGNLLGSLTGAAQPKRILGLPSEVTTAVVNTKGGAGKTTIAILVAAAAAQLAGHHDIAVVDVNPSGNLRRRTQHAATGNVVDLADAIQQGRIGDSQRDLDPWISWQPTGWWFTITAPPGTRTTDGTPIRPLTGQNVDALVDVLHRTCRLLIIDTGNNAGDDIWQHAINHAMPILVPIQWDPDTLTRAQEMLTDLEAAGQTRLRDRVILVGTHSPWQHTTTRSKKTTAEALTAAGWAVNEIPADPHIAAGGIIEWTQLAARTRRAATTLVERIIHAATTGTTTQEPHNG